MLAQKQINQSMTSQPAQAAGRISVLSSAVSCRRPIARRAFTLIELLVVISIIAILIGILLPALSKFRLQGYITSTTAELNSLRAACLMYYSNYDAYPGPFSESDIASGKVTQPGSIGVSGGVPRYPQMITGTQNMLIGLMGTMYAPPAYASQPPAASLPAGTSIVPIYCPSGTVWVTNPLGSGPIDYTKGNAQEKSYLSPDVTLLATAPPNSNPATSYVPTLYDSFPDGLPILYYRKNPGLPGPKGIPVQPDSTFNGNNTQPGAF